MANLLSSKSLNVRFLEGRVEKRVTELLPPFGAALATDFLSLDSDFRFDVGDSPSVTSNESILFIFDRSKNMITNMSTLRMTSTRLAATTMAMIVMTAGRENTLLFVTVSTVKGSVKGLAVGEDDGSVGLLLEVEVVDSETELGV